MTKRNHINIFASNWKIFVQQLIHPKNILSLLQNEEAEDWVTIGVVVHKSDPKSSNKSGKLFSIIKLCDLQVNNIFDFVSELNRSSFKWHRIRISERDFFLEFRSEYPTVSLQRCSYGTVATTSWRPRCGNLERENVTESRRLSGHRSVYWSSRETSGSWRRSGFWDMSGQNEGG